MSGDASGLAASISALQPSTSTDVWGSIAGFCAADVVGVFSAGAPPHPAIAAAATTMHSPRLILMAEL
ncbi:Uncharacterised protein [Mycobacteroides abscessus subsp. abscessus]|nr:Uncharacterised protein [Mycobacteroides abscessus subsp. abscessus]